jgi:hypothetical protein
MMLNPLLMLASSPTPHQTTVTRQESKTPISHSICDESFDLLPIYFCVAPNTVVINQTIANYVANAVHFMEKVRIHPCRDSN